MGTLDLFAPWIDERSPQQREIDRAITMLDRRWSSLPAMVAQRGWFEVVAGEPRGRVDGVEVPDGRYRVEGHEWLLTFKDGALVRGDRLATRVLGSVELGGVKVDPRSYRTVSFTA